MAAGRVSTGLPGRLTAAGGPAAVTWETPARRAPARRSLRISRRYARKSTWMVSLAERAYRLVVAARYLAISRFICGSGGRAARPWSRSATHCDWISAIGMMAPIG